VKFFLRQSNSEWKAVRTIKRWADLAEPHQHSVRSDPMSNTVTALRLVQIGVRVPVLVLGARAALRAEKRQVRYLVSEVCAEQVAASWRGHVDGTTHSLPVLLWEQDCHRLDLSVKRHPRVTVCCAGPSKVSQARRSDGRSTSLHQNSRKGHLCQEFTRIDGKRRCPYKFTHVGEQSTINRCPSPRALNLHR
jgi:hypothetical protein